MTVCGARWLRSHKRRACWGTWGRGRSCGHFFGGVRKATVRQSGLWANGDGRAPTRYCFVNEPALCYISRTKNEQRAARAPQRRRLFP